MPNIRPMALGDAVAWAAMRCVLFTDGSAAEHAEEIAAFFAGSPLHLTAALGAFALGPTTTDRLVTFRNNLV